LDDLACKHLLTAELARVFHVVDYLLQHLVLGNVLNLVDLLAGLDLVADVLEQVFVRELAEELGEVISLTDASHQLTGVMRLY
jgi:hypothetical protein